MASSGEDLDQLWAQAKPVKAAPAEDLDALWEQAKPAAAVAAPPPKTTGHVRGGRVPQIHTQAPGSGPDLSAPSDTRPEDWTDTAGAALQGAGQGITLGFGDEMEGKLGQAQEVLGRIPGLSGIRPDRTAAQKAVDEDVGEPELGESLTRAYHNGRDTARNLDKDADARHPWAYGGGRVAGDLLTQTALNAATGGAFLSPGGQAVLGGVSGLGNSEADLTSGNLKDYGKAAFDTGLSAGTSYGLGKLGQYFGRGLGKIANRAEAGITDAGDRELAKQTALQLEREASAAGLHGSDVQKLSRTLENAQRALQYGSPEEKKLALQLLNSPEAQKVSQQILGRAIEETPGQLTKADASKTAWQELLANHDQSIADATEDSLAHPWSKQVAPRIKHMANKLVPAAIGSVFGGPAGAVAGSAVSLVAGHSGTTMSNMVKSTPVRKMAWEAVKYATETAPEKLGPFAKPLLAAAARGETALQAMDSVLDSMPGYLELKTKLLGGDQEPAGQE